MIKQQRFAPFGVLALNPKAFGLVVDCYDPKPAALTENGVAVVTIRGPLMHRADFFFDSYEEIKARVAAAIALAPRAILLDVDSPGGLVSGAFDCSRELRAMAAAHGVALHAFVGAQATSAAYALASAASRISVSASASIGSVGVIDMLVDQTAQNQMLGLNVQLVTSGARKADGNPDSPITDEAFAATQARVDTLATMFFELVVEHEWGGSVERLRGLQASIMTGGEAVKMGLATEIASYDQAIAFASTTDDRSRSEVTAKGTNTMDEDKKDAIASLRKMAEGDDPDMAKAARAALAALGAEDEPAAEGDDKPDDDDDAPAAEGDDDAPAAEGDDDEDKPDAKAAASGDALAMAAQALASVHKINVERANEKAANERSKLLASRPDFAPELVKVLRSAPMATVRDMCKTLPRGPARKDRAAAAQAATPTRGDGQGDGTAARLPANEKAALDLQMGLASNTTATVHTPNRMSFGVRVPASAGATPSK